MTVELLNVDCMEYMRTQPDGAFDLAVVDPPYGIGMDGGEWNNTPVGQKSIKGKSKGLRVEKKDWDKKTPGPEYFAELQRVSRRQIVWGGNYFTAYLEPQRCWLCWDKKQPDGVKFSQFELAWTSLDEICQTFRMYPTHVAQGKKIHPTQKPIRLYDWTLNKYAEKGQRVLDTHLGSGSSAIAAHYFGVDFVGCEIDEDYYRAAVARFEEATKQLALFG